MKHYRHAIWLAAVLTSCVVGSFSVVEELPGGQAGAGGAAAGSGSGGKSSGGDASGNGGSQTPSGGKPQGGQTTQGGSAPQAGEPTTGDAGEASGGVGGDPGIPGVVAPKPCDAENGALPILCDDFEAGFDNRWAAPAGVAPESMMGPHGVTTHAAHLKNGQQLDGLIPSFGVDTANAQVTMSFWFKLVTQGGNITPLVEFQSQQNAPIQLMTDIKDLHWSAQGNARAPSLSGNGNIPIGQWHCVSIYLTKGGNMTLSYFSGAQPLKVVTVVVDQVPTPNVDDIWLNNVPEPLRTILGRPKLGPSPVDPGDVAFDDVRIVHGKTNVCGL